MFKAISKLLVITSIFVSVEALAVALPGWERPVATSSLQIMKSTGIFTEISESQIVLTKRDGATEPTGVQINLDDEDLFFTITDIKESACGATVYQASMLQEVVGLATETVSLELIDNTASNNCSNEISAWEVVLEHVELDKTVGQSLISLGGEPQPVFTIQGIGL